MQTNHDPRRLGQAPALRSGTPDRVWFTDTTQYRSAGGWVYCCAAVKAYSRKIVGWSIADHISTELVVDTLADGSADRRRARSRT